MAGQTELMVIGFEGKHRAAEVLNQIEAMNLSFAIDLKDAVAVYRTDDGRLRLDTSVQPTTKEGAAWGAALGGFIGALLLAPFTAGASAAVAATALGVGAFTGGVTGAAIGADDAAFGMLPAHQCFERDHHIVFGADHRLIMQFEQLVGERVA